MSDWLCIIRPPRATFIADMRDDERAVMSEHFAYLERLLGEGRLLLAGPSLDPPFGIIVLVADSEEEAWELMRADPSVRAGVQTPELHPFRTSLLAGRD
ncbi:MAG: YciI family protein [Actinomycetota bacterium]|nr:YciI family protein [Actinomycetota bacterium]